MSAALRTSLRPRARARKPVWWTRERVRLAGARALRELGAVPASITDYQALQRSAASPLDFPGYATILRHFATMGDFWRAAGARDLPPQISREKKYFATDEIDEELRRIYLERRGRRTSEIGDLRALGTRVGWPKHALRKRARELGLARTKEPVWSKAELELLDRWSYMTDEVLSRKLREAGFSRTATGVRIQMKRRKLRKGKKNAYYTANGLAELLGIDAHAVTGWIRRGLLAAMRRESARTARQNGDTYLIRPTDLHAFVIANPDEIDLRKVDQRWFLHLITQGAVRIEEGEATAPPAPTTPRPPRRPRPLLVDLIEEAPVEDRERLRADLDRLEVAAEQLARVRKIVKGR